MSTSCLGPVDFNASFDEEGHRTYTIIHKVQGDRTDGPYNIINTPGLPAIGAYWQWFGEVDPYAWCRASRNIVPLRKTEAGPVQFWLVTSTYSTKPGKKCQDQPITDPLNEPQRLSGSFVRYTKDALTDRHGTQLMSSSWERLTGDAIKVDCGRATVRIEQNVLSLGLSTVTQLMHKVNSSPMWGVSSRCVKLSEFSWERLVRGTCGYYYRRAFEFEIRFDTFDEEVADVGTKCLRGHIDPESHSWVTDASADYNNPLDFDVFKDARGSACKVFLNGYGAPVQASGGGAGEPVTATLEKYDEANFFILGIPASL